MKYFCKLCFLAVGTVLIFTNKPYAQSGWVAQTSGTTNLLADIFFIGAAL